MVKCGVSLSPASQRGQCHLSLSQGTARRTPTSWPSSRPDRTSCRGQVRALSPAAPPGPRSWSGPRLGRGGVKLEQQGAEEVGSFRRFPKPRAGPCSHLPCPLLPPPGDSPRRQPWTHRDGPRGWPAQGLLPAPLGKAPLRPQLFRISGHLSPEPAPSICLLQTGSADRRFGNSFNPQLEILLSCWSLVLASKL